MAAPFAKLGITVTDVHRSADPVRAVREAEAVAVAGGNTFVLLKRIYDSGLLQPVRERVAGGMPYVGWSAGTNVACPTIRTANDMAIVMPPSFDGFGLVPFQINPHFIPGKPAGHNVETREERLQEFMLMNLARPLWRCPKEQRCFARTERPRCLATAGRSTSRQEGPPPGRRGTASSSTASRRHPRRPRRPRQPAPERREFGI